MIYVICPPNVVTGGPDALHQLVYYLNSNKLDAKITYIRTFKKESASIPIEYQCYVDDFCYIDEIDDNINNSVVFPETAIIHISKIKNAKKYVWWLSVDNNIIRSGLINKVIYAITLPLRVYKNKKYYSTNLVTKVLYNIHQQVYDFDNEMNDVVHLCASYYAFDYVKNRSNNKVYKFIEPISKKFLDNYKEDHNDKISKENIVLFNPTKCGKYVSKLIDYNPNMKYIPLRGYNQNELISMYKRAKLFIDFGPFPGAERMPKEAVLYGCSILTGLHGASGYHGDVPIPDEFKIDETITDIKLISNKIENMLKNYDNIIDCFDEYKHTVLHLEDNFIKSIHTIFE